MGAASGRSELDGEESDDGVLGDDDRLRMVNVKCGSAQPLYCLRCSTITLHFTAYVRSKEQPLASAP